MISLTLNRYLYPKQIATVHTVALGLMTIETIFIKKLLVKIILSVSTLLSLTSCWCDDEQWDDVPKEIFSFLPYEGDEVLVFETIDGKRDTIYVTSNTTEKSYISTADGVGIEAKCNRLYYNKLDCQMRSDLNSPRAPDFRFRTFITETGEKYLEHQIGGKTSSTVLPNSFNDTIELISPILSVEEMQRINHITNLTLRKDIGIINYKRFNDGIYYKIE